MKKNYLQCKFFELIKNIEGEKKFFKLMFWVDGWEKDLDFENCQK